MTEKSPAFKFNKREWIVILLFLSCSVSAILLWKAEPLPPQKLQTTAQLDSLITRAFYLNSIQPSQIRERSVEIDSTFIRKIYSVRVPSGFSKTSFHYHLHTELLPYSVQTIGNVKFPENDISIQIVYNNNVLRTVLLQTDPLLNLPE